MNFESEIQFIISPVVPCTKDIISDYKLMSYGSYEVNDVWETFQRGLKAWGKEILKWRAKTNFKEIESSWNVYASRLIRLFHKLQWIAATNFSWWMKFSKRLFLFSRQNVKIVSHLTKSAKILACSFQKALHDWKQWR